MKLIKLNIVLFILGISLMAVPLFAAPNLSKRYEVDAKRVGVNALAEEGLAASREFIRIDSTYYVGWMFQGMYLSERANDYLGYKNAIPALEKALTLIEIDFPKQLRLKSSDIYVYYPVKKYQNDYSTIAYYLFKAYQNTQLEEESYRLLRRVLSLDMQKNLVLHPYNMLSWITHRNRFYTHEKYSFLKSSIQENEKLANRYLDSSIAYIYKNQAYNYKIYSQEQYGDYDLLSVYHYKALIHSYNFNLDSAAHYFSLMDATNMFPHNNFAIFLSIQAKFKDAYNEFMTASTAYQTDKRLEEWAYYTSILNIYRAMPLQSALGMREIIKAVGSTPGYGWYNIAIARASTYLGNIAESEKYLDRAAHFKEVHIGTTLGQAQYEFSINLVQLLNKTKAIQQVKFENKNWWWQPKVWFKLSRLRSEKYFQQYLITTQFATNPERDNVIYKLFASESTVSWDEIWFLIKDFSTNYFYKKFEDELKQDKRENVYKYYQLFLAKLDIEKGNYQQAKERLEKTLTYVEDIDVEYEALFLARAYEALKICTDETGDDKNAQLYAAKMYSTFPQLVPFADFKPEMNFTIIGNNATIINQLKKYRIDWTTSNKYAPKANITFGTKEGKVLIKYAVDDFMGNTIIAQNEIVVEDEKEAVEMLAYGLFGIVSLDTQPDIDQAN